MGIRRVTTITAGVLIPAIFCLVPTVVALQFSLLQVFRLKLTLRHAIYSAILNTASEATATFMLLPASGRHMITNLYSQLLNAYPHPCYKLGTIPKSKLTYDKPQSW
eukprot:943120-Pelagomonas_calceolata.AAC.1